MAVTQTLLDDLEAKHKRVAHLKGPGDPVPWEVVIRKPTRPEYKQFRAMSHNPSQVSEAQEVLIRKICVYPERDALDALLDDWPGIPESCGKAIASLAGISAQEDVK